MPFLFGVVMGVAGFAMLVMGKITLPGGRVIEGKPARRAGGVWLSFFPVVFLASFVLRLLELDGVIDPRLVFWIVCTLCLCVGVGFLLPAWPAARPRRQRRPAAVKASAANPFETPPAAPAMPASAPPLGPEPEPWRAPAMGKPAHSPPPEKNPFDFS